MVISMFMSGYNHIPTIMSRVEAEPRLAFEVYFYRWYMI
jgi:hypothetical protein